jgi:hypothetical protein
MLNMIDTQDKLKNFSEAQLIREMQMPSGSAPQFMVLGEIERRKRMRAEAQKQEGLMKPTVAQEAVSAAGVPQQGIAQVAQSLAPKTDMTQNTGVTNIPASRLAGQPNQPQRMAGGGIMRLAPGGQVSGGAMTAIALLKVNYPELYERYKDSPELADVALAAVQEAKTPEKTGLEMLEAPRSNNFLKTIFSDPTRGDIIDQQKKDARDFGEDYAAEQARLSKEAMRRARIDPYSTVFAEGSPVELTGRKVPIPKGVVPVESTTLESLEVPRREALINLGRNQTRNPNGSDMVDTSFIEPDIIRSYDEGTSLNPIFNFARNRRNAARAKERAEEFGEGYALDQRRQSRRNLGEYSENDPIFAEGSVVEPVPNVSANALADGTAVPQGTRTEGLRALEFARGQAQGLPSSYTPLAERADDEAKRAYLSGKDFDEKGLPAVVGMLNKAREFQQSDTYTPPEKVYVDLTGNSPLGGLKYTMDGATDQEKDAQFAKYASRLEEERNSARERADLAAQERAALKEKRPRLRPESDAEVASNTNITPFKNKAPLVGYDTAEGLGALIKPARDTSTKETAESSGAAKSSGSGDKQTFKSTAKGMNQDKWLALAQAGLTLMSTGDFGKAGQAGLAALQQSKDAELAERKFALDERLVEAKIAAAGRKGGVKAPSASALTFYQTRVENAQVALEEATKANNKSGMLAADAALTKARNDLEQLVAQFGAYQGLLTSPGGSSSGRDKRDVASGEK